MEEMTQIDALVSYLVSHNANPRTYGDANANVPNLKNNPSRRTSEARAEHGWIITADDTKPAARYTAHHWTCARLQWHVRLAASRGVPPHKVYARFVGPAPYGSDEPDCPCAGLKPSRQKPRDPLAPAAAAGYQAARAQEASPGGQLAAEAQRRTRDSFRPRSTPAADPIPPPLPADAEERARQIRIELGLGPAPAGLA